MEKFFNAYTITEIIVFVILLAIAIKGLVTFIDWATERLKKKFKKDSVIEKKRDLVEKYFKQQQNMQEQLELITNKIELLVLSDKEDIKAYITERHHYFCNKGWIDNYHREILEKRFGYYKKEGGNSFILGFMEDIRELPSQPPKDN